VELAHDDFECRRRVGIGSEAHAKDAEGVMRSAEYTALAKDEQDDLPKVVEVLPYAATRHGAVSWPGKESRALSNELEKIFLARWAMGVGR
jgi:hypothetical protein